MQKIATVSDKLGVKRPKRENLVTAGTGASRFSVLQRYHPHLTAVVPAKPNVGGLGPQPLRHRLYNFYLPGGDLQEHCAAILHSVRQLFQQPLNKVQPLGAGLQRQTRLVVSHVRL